MENIQKPLKIDLHCHTHVSDGALSPEELLLRASQMQLDYLSITDHDAVGGYQQAVEAAKKYQNMPALIPGVEISCRWQRYEIHILGWHFDPTHPALLNLLAQQQEKRSQRAEKIASKLIRLGVDEAHLPVAEAGRVRTRFHFAQNLERYAYVDSIQAAFKRYLGKRKPAYIATDWCSIEEAVQAILAAGGTAAIAHPHAYDMKQKKLRQLIGYFKSVGGTTLEVAIGQQAPEQREELAVLAQEFELFASVGSDFHFIGPWRELGRNLELPAGCQAVWQQWNLSESAQI